MCPFVALVLYPCCTLRTLKVRQCAGCCTLEGKKRGSGVWARQPAFEWRAGQTPLWSGESHRPVTYQLTYC